MQITMPRVNNMRTVGKCRERQMRSARWNYSQGHPSYVCFGRGTQFFLGFVSGGLMTMHVKQLGMST